MALLVVFYQANHKELRVLITQIQRMLKLETWALNCRLFRQARIFFLLLILILIHITIKSIDLRSHLIGELNIIDEKK